MPLSIAIRKEIKIAIELTCEWTGNEVRIVIRKSKKKLNTKASHRRNHRGVLDSKPSASRNRVGENTNPKPPPKGNRHERQDHHTATRPSTPGHAAPDRNQQPPYANGKNDSSTTSRLTKPPVNETKWPPDNPGATPNRRKETAMNKVTMMRGIAKLYFAGALTGSFIHIVTSAHKMGGEGAEAYATPFLIDGLAVMGMTMRSDEFSKRTNRIGFKIQCVTGAMSLGMNVYAAKSLFGVLFGIALVGCFILAEWLNDTIEGKEVDDKARADAATAAAEAIVQAASAFLATCTHPTTCATAKQCQSKTKAQKTIAKKKRTTQQQVKVLNGMMGS